MSSASAQNSSGWMMIFKNLVTFEVFVQKLPKKIFLITVRQMSTSSSINPLWWKVLGWFQMISIKWHGMNNCGCIDVNQSCLWPSFRIFWNNKLAQFQLLKDLFGTVLLYSFGLVSVFEIFILRFYNICCGPVVEYWFGPVKE